MVLKGLESAGLESNPFNNPFNLLIDRLFHRKYVIFSTFSSMFSNNIYFY